MRFNADITVERLKEILRYDPLTGVFTYLVRRGKEMPGNIAGRLNGKGYRQITIEGRTYTAQRLAWLYMTGAWPAVIVDHENLNPDDNRWVNLREATYSQNVTNTKPRANNKLGIKGVVELPSGRFQAAIRENGKQKYIGSFDTSDLASAAYQDEARRLHGEFARTE